MQETLAKGNLHTHTYIQKKTTHLGHNVTTSLICFDHNRKDGRVRSMSVWIWVPGLLLACPLWWFTVCLGAANYLWVLEVSECDAKAHAMPSHILSHIGHRPLAQCRLPVEISPVILTSKHQHLSAYEANESDHFCWTSDCSGYICANLGGRN